MNNRKQILIILGGIALAIVLIVSNIRPQHDVENITPASQKKPKQNTPALLDGLL